ncbi:metallophosphoesterase 1-like [Zingiber officinale]|uniref:metallophosphoesterase 1-like n=1 Tax=Zingiber officinale TaxID=94328 RepID=UPI001C4D91DF|nr:metallophosphoesterase 1-like [Zingiber officinale]
MSFLKPLLPLLLAIALVAVEYMISEPSCVVSGRVGESERHSDDLKVIMVADLLLPGSDAGYTDTFFRDPFKSKFFRKSLEKFRPDMLLVLGDVSARGWELTESKWRTVMQQFYKLLGPFMGLPLHIALGDRDIGECSELDEQFASQIVSSLPSLGLSGCSSFEMGNVSFVSLNSVALLCGTNDLRFRVEKVIERESIVLRNRAKETEILGKPSFRQERSNNFQWRDNKMESGSGPVLLLHFPLHRKKRSILEVNDVNQGICKHTDGDLRRIKDSKFKDMGPYALQKTFPVNETEYVLQALKPRIVFSAHSHKFCDHTHSDGTREVTVPAMTWTSGQKPGLVFVNFGHNKEVSVSHCSFVSERHVILLYLCVFMLSMSVVLIARCLNLVK